ncbi:MAG: 2-hydroxyacid dehydrogenase [Aurantimonas endophytica]|uniref:2-hydroxyacid dehydrogenase n=1 Tax=Aurantimonas endophytica TaxID=1522175 RepID=UPI0030029B02
MASPELVALAQPYLAPFLTEAVAERYRFVDIGQQPGVASDARAVVVDGGRPFDASLREAMPRLGLIACFNAGYDGIDVEWARKHGIIVTHARHINHEDVADFAIGQVLNVYRKIGLGDRWVRDGSWQSGNRLMTRSIAGLRLGIVGLGSIGQALARRADAMRMVTSWWGPHHKSGVPWPRASSLIDLAAESDALVIAASAKPSNRGLISASVIEALGPGGMLVNVARGSLVDEAAVIVALMRGTLGAAVLDVYDEEPTSPDRWAGVPNVFLTPHIAGVTDLAMRRMVELLGANLDAFFKGEPVPTPVSLAA